MKPTDCKPACDGGFVASALFGGPQKVLKARLKVATATLEQIANLPRGGLAKRLAVSTLHFITPPPPKLYPRLICPHCGKARSVSKNGFRPHHHHGEWCKGTYQQPPNEKLTDHHPR